MEWIGQWLANLGREPEQVQHDMDERVDAVIERVNAVVSRSRNMDDPPAPDSWENELW